MMKAPNEKDCSGKDNEEQGNFWTFNESLIVAAWILAAVFVFMVLPWMIKL